VIAAADQLLEAPDRIGAAVWAVALDDDAAVLQIVDLELQRNRDPVNAPISDRPESRS
jgi:hypothetical protein